MMLIVLLTSSCVATLATNKPVQMVTESSVLPIKKPTSIVQSTQIEIAPTLNQTTPPSSTSTISHTPTVTLTPYPTLETEQAMETIKTFLHDGGDCEKPCFLGILPGESTLSEAKSIFMHLGLPTKKITYEGKDIYGTRYDFDNGLSVTGNITVQDEIVKNLRIDITPETPKAGFQRGWLVFSPETLISHYGQPSSVSFALDWGPRSYFEMDIYFDTDDLIVIYSGDDLIPRQKGSPTVCPLSAAFDNIQIWMGKDPINPPMEAVPLERATSMTIEEFSKLMTGNPDQACFTVNSEMFP
jgi:hypothetical protein